MLDLQISPISWKYYSQAGQTPATALWTAPNAIAGICGLNGNACAGSDWINNVQSVFPNASGYPNSFSPILTDLGADANQQQCTLPAVSWVIPNGGWSDHANLDPHGAGPSWVAAIVNAVGGYDNSGNKLATNCGYWANTVILITWDDWGGFYDHVLPWRCSAALGCLGYDNGSGGVGGEYVYGFRVPLLVVSAYAKQGYISGKLPSPGEVQPYVHDFGSILNFIEYAFGQGMNYIGRSFKDNDPDGDEINGTLTADAAGNLYGGTTFGGGPNTYGTVFEMTQGSSGWTLTVIHRFRPPIPACCPEAGMVMDEVGNLYGTAANPFELSPSSDGWKLTLLHNFPSYQGDGSGPYAVILDAAGNLYGETNMGGTSTLCGGGCGTVYELHRTSGGWKEHILHDFGTGGDDMGFPGGALLLDKTGRLYGTAGGGTHAHGAVYRLTPQSGGHWKASILHSFTGGANGDGPDGGVVMDKSGNLYGTTIAGGDSNCGCGVVYKLSPGSNGKWSYTVLHRFTGYDGAQPAASPILDSKGNLYGTTITGGTGGYGVAFEITP